MKKNLLKILSVAFVLTLSSCMSFITGISGPDGENDNIVYGYIDPSRMEIKANEMQFLPWDVEVVWNKKGDDYKLKGGKLGMFTQMELTGAIHKNVFTVENVEPGYYYMFSISGMMTRGGRTILHDLIFSRPDNKDQAIYIDKNELLYWGAADVIPKGGTYSLEPATNITQEEVTEILISNVEGTAWVEFIASHR